MNETLSQQRAREVDNLCNAIADLIEGADAIVIGAALSEVVACFIASQSPTLREPTLELFVSAVTTSWPAIAEELVDQRERTRHGNTCGQSRRHRPRPD